MRPRPLVLALLLSLVALGPACFKEPRPKCSFLCGESGACPEGYVCGATDNRCHLAENGAPATCEDSLPPDGPPGADGSATFDAPPTTDGAADATIATPDAPTPDADVPDAEIADASSD